MTNLSVELVIECEGENEICLDSSDPLETILECCRNHIDSIQANIHLLYNRKGKWTKLVDEKIYQRLIAQAIKDGEDEIHLKLQIIKFNIQSPRCPSALTLARDEVHTWETSSFELIAVDLEYRYRILNRGNPDTRPVSIGSISPKLLELNSAVLASEGLSNDWCCAFYSVEGFPLTGTLEQMAETDCTDLLQPNSTVLVLIVPATNITFPTSLLPDRGSDTIVLQCATHESRSYHIKVDLESATILEIKRKLYSLECIPPSQLSVEDLNDDYLIKCRVQPGGTLKYQKQSPGTADRFSRVLYKEKLARASWHSKSGLRTLYAMLTCLSAEDAGINLELLLASVRRATNNFAPLVHALSELIRCKRLSDCELIALEEGFYMLTQTIAKTVFDKDLDKSAVLEHSIEMFAFGCDTYKKLSPNVQHHEQYLEYNTIDSLTREVLKEPVRVKKDNGEYSFYEYDALARLRGENIEGVSNLSSQSLIVDEKCKVVIHSCALTSKQSLWVWEGQYNPEPTFRTQVIRAYPGGVRWEQLRTIQQGLSITRVVPPLSLQRFRKCLTLDPKNKLRVSLGPTPCSEGNVDLMHPLTETTISCDVHELARTCNVSMINPDVPLPSVTRTPEEAIAVVLDRSGSMSTLFEHDHSRLSVVKQLFASFSDRTAGYDYKHVISLFTFSDTIRRMCDFTESVATFGAALEEVAPESMTKLFDTVAESATYLSQFKQTYPNCVLRILCLSDGKENGSSEDPYQLCNTLQTHNIVLDSIVIGSTCKRLKALTLATGGSIFYPKTLKDGIKLFESEAFLSVRNRANINKQTVSSRSSFNRLKELEASSELPTMKRPAQINERMQSPSTALERAAAVPPVRLDRLLVNRFKRIFRELNSLNSDPHPDVQIFPSTSDANFWGLFFKGPEGTPYAGGLFRAYALFSENYPLSPPEIRFVTPIYHCNINSDGRICHSILNHFYQVDVTMREIINHLYGLLMTPEPTHPLDANIAAEYLDNRTAFEENARVHTRTHAMRTLKDYTGEIDDSSAMKDMLDPISGEIMQEPMLCVKSNQTYERANIERIIDGTGRDPISGDRITRADLRPNNALLSMIKSYRGMIQNSWFT